MSTTLRVTMTACTAIVEAEDGVGKLKKANFVSPSLNVTRRPAVPLALIRTGCHLKAIAFLELSIGLSRHGIELPSSGDVVLRYR